MKYRNLGKSRLRVSCLALGGNIFGYVCDKKGTGELIRSAGDLGINLIDTADVYSDGISEEYIGAAIKNCRNKWIIATKVGVRTGEPANGKGSKRYIMNAIDASLRRLGTDHIDLYQMHHFDAGTPIEETLEALNELIKQGKVLHIGCSNYNAEQLKGSFEAARAHCLKPFSTLQSSYNLFKRDIEDEIFRVCSEKGIGFIAYGVLARGVLSGKYNAGQEIPKGSRASLSKNVRADLNDTVSQAVARLTAFAGKRGKSVGNLALAWALHREEVSTVVMGVRNMGQLKENIGSVGWELSGSELLEIDDMIGDLGQFKEVSLGSFTKQ